MRQKGYDGEIWDLTCLDPEATVTAAAISLRDEIALSQHLSSQEQDAALSHRQKELGADVPGDSEFGKAMGWPTTSAATSRSDR